MTCTRPPQWDQVNGLDFVFAKVFATIELTNVAFFKVMIHEEDFRRISVAHVGEPRSKWHARRFVQSWSRNLKKMSNLWLSKMKITSLYLRDFLIACVDMFFVCQLGQIFATANENVVQHDIGRVA